MLGLDVRMASKLVCWRQTAGVVSLGSVSYERTLANALRRSGQTIVVWGCRLREQVSSVVTLIGCHHAALNSLIEPPASVDFECSIVCKGCLWTVLYRVLYDLAA